LIVVNIKSQSYEGVCAIYFKDEKLGTKKEIPLLKGEGDAHRQMGGG
jgi:hypothetical protein